MAVQMKALRSFPYAGKRIKAGEIFTARGTLRPGSDAMTLKAIGHAVECDDAAPSAPEPYLHRAMTAAPVAEPVAHTYQTRATEVDGLSGTGRVEVAADSNPDLDAMDKESLHALAIKLGVKVHHLAGASKVREAIRKAKS